MKLKSVLIFIFLLSINFTLCFSQNNELQIPTPKLTDDLKILDDTVCYYFKFFTQDSLFFRVEAIDSIIINKNPPLIKKRNSKILYVCDSVSKNNHYFISQIMYSFESKESEKKDNWINRTESAWLNRRIQYEIDLHGKRYSYKYDDSTNTAMSPGSAFEPDLFFFMGDTTCKRINQRWMVSSKDELCENSNPAPIINQTSLMNPKSNIDTMDWNCNRLEYIRTGQGGINLIMPKSTVKITNVFNGFGCLDISSIENIPVHFFATIENKLDITYDKRAGVPGKHYITINYTLEKLVRPNKK